MKKAIVLIFVLALIFTLSSCKNTENNGENLTDIQDKTEQITEKSSSQSDLNIEDYSTDLNEPGFDFPRIFSETEKYINLSEYDNSKKTGDSEDFFSDGKRIFSKTYDSNGNTSLITVFEADGEMKQSSYKFQYEENDERSVDIEFYKEGLVSERRKYSYYENGSIHSVYTYTQNEDTGSPVINSYEYNEQGELTQHIGSDSFSQIILDAVLSGLGG